MGLGDTPILRVLDFFMIYEEFDYSMTDIAKHAGIGYSTLKLFWSHLEKSNIVENTRIIGKAKMYALNQENSIVKFFKNFYWQDSKVKINQIIN